MNSLRFAYDPHRGGFCVSCEPVGHLPAWVNLFGGLLKALRSKQDARLVAVTSDWGFGGLPLQALTMIEHIPSHLVRDKVPEGKFSFKSCRIQEKGVTVVQSLHQIEFWFGCLPIQSPSNFYDPEIAVGLWLSDKTVSPWPPTRHRECRIVLGLSLGFQSLAARYPVESVEFAGEDFN